MTLFATAIFYVVTMVSSPNTQAFCWPQQIVSQIDDDNIWLKTMCQQKYRTLSIVQHVLTFIDVDAELACFEIGEIKI